MRQLFLGIDLDQRDVVNTVTRENPPGIAGLIGQRYLNLRTTADHVTIGEDLAIGVDQETRSQFLLGNQVEENGSLVDGAGDVDHAVLGGLIDVDVVLLIGAQAGGASGGGAAPQGRVGNGAAQGRVGPGGVVHKSAHQQDGQKQSSKSHGLLSLLKDSYTARVCSTVRCLSPEVSMT